MIKHINFYHHEKSYINQPAESIQKKIQRRGGKEMEAVMPMNGFMELTEDNLMVIDGGVNYDRIFAGNTVEFSAALAVALVPEVSIPAAVIAGVLMAAGCGYSIYGIYSN
ncbi:hypothetical protein ACETAC_05765 [Aceticella autotrophica]|uniref:Uncharacterized protein n=1 Tax=Aceticella autotrophica TaxID=2755338 RepID=A0A975ATV7_9THEO|nr:hypothetical protein [Aceticella autotrophica]QSZ26444.1 hypothetical protein ACETAC_05765 [Aceticella autotrophica]